ncbi:glycosyltransferase [Anabaena catenula]|uniref:Glycosyltransferase n=1 Tax=Anabaena catenula FACHB-362 TaxID=2692877 RepID=A0ABR8J4A5_9NOST|nr:glycosyltransferase [Anabaena catenula]MBD2693189.1 glycosyltransferase [Anabaena catenula FACHB-362]
MPLISVIIPVYNGEKTIRKTIDCVLKQSFSLLEIIVINDGSTDATLEIVQSISDSRLQVFSYVNSGLSASRNRGLVHASGEFISFIDADDLWTSDKLEDQIKALQENPKAAVAYSWTDYIDGDDKFIKRGRHSTITGDVYTKLLLFNVLENGSNPLIRKEAFNTICGFDESLPAAEDWDMWLRLAAKYEFVVVPKAQILYRLSMHSMSTNLKKQEAGCLEVIERGFANPKAESLRHLKKDALSNIYKYLTFKSLEASPDKLNRWISVGFLWNCVRYNPAVLKQHKIMLIAVLKIAFPGLYVRIQPFWKGNN